MSKEAKNITLERNYPSQYPQDAVKILNAMSFSHGKHIKIVGSSALRSQQYAGDYDAHEEVSVHYKTIPEALQHLVKDFQRIILNLSSMKNVYIGDIKSGIIEEWDILKNPERIEHLVKEKIISKKEAEEAHKLLQDTSKVGRLKAKQELKYHIIRWKPKQILEGKQTLRDGRTYTLEEAFSSPTITKLDTTALIQERYTELSIIYQFKNNNTILNNSHINIQNSLKDAIELYEAEGNQFKVIKRKFALAKLLNNSKDIKKYHGIINSEIGKLYVVYSDVKTLRDLLERHSIPKSNLSEAINGFQHRLSRIYQNEYYLKKEPQLLNDLSKIKDTKNALPILTHIETQLMNILNKGTVKKLSGGYLPYIE